MHRLILFYCSTCATGNSRLPCVKTFAGVRKHGHTANLPFAVCQLKQHTANGWHTANLLFAVCQAKTHTVNAQHMTKVWLCRVLHMEAHGKESLYVVCLQYCARQNLGTRQTCAKKIESALPIFSAIYIQCILVLIKIWYISRYFGYI